MSDRVWIYIGIAAAAVVTAIGIWELDHGSWLLGGGAVLVGVTQARRIIDADTKG